MTAVEGFTYLPAHGRGEVEIYVRVGYLPREYLGGGRRVPPRPPPSSFLAPNDGAPRGCGACCCAGNSARLLTSRLTSILERGAIGSVVGDGSRPQHHLKKVIKVTKATKVPFDRGGYLDEAEKIIPLSDHPNKSNRASGE